MSTVHSVSIPIATNRTQIRNSPICSSSSKRYSTTPALQYILSQRRQNSLSSTPLSLSTSHSTTSLFSYVSNSTVDDHSYVNNISNFNSIHPLNMKCNFLSFDVNGDDTNSECDSSFFMEDDLYDEADTFDDIDESFFTSKVSLIKPMETTKLKNKNKPSLFSNLTTSFKRFTSSTSNLLYTSDEIFFSDQPRLTDDKLPTTNYQDQELTTFKITTSFPNTTNSTVFKSRESRINPEFLKLYAFETSSRLQGFLKNVDQVEDISGIDLNRLSDQQLALSLKVREKLWDSVVLPPREDILPMSSISNSEYINLSPQLNINSKVQNSSNSNTTTSLLTNGLRHTPWLQLNDIIENSSKSIKPRGYLNNNTQFTVKGWVNKKWIPIAAAN